MGNEEGPKVKTCFNEHARTIPFYIKISTMQKKSYIWTDSIVKKIITRNFASTVTVTWTVQINIQVFKI
jgi:hypothetical protein